MRWAPISQKGLYDMKNQKYYKLRKLILAHTLFTRTSNNLMLYYCQKKGKITQLFDALSATIAKTHENLMLLISANTPQIIFYKLRIF